MKKYLFFALIIALASFLGSCDTGNTAGQTLTPAQGGKYYGGVFKTNETEFFRSLYPLNITEVVGHRITNQIYEGLVSLSQKDLSIEPCLATSWSVNESATEYVFHLRKGVKFHDDECFADGKGREFTAKDVKYCLDKLCEADPNNQGFWVFQGLVKGADEYNQSTVDGKPLEGGVSGVEVVDDSTIKITLLRPFASFLQKMALPFCQIFPKEAFDKYGIQMREKCVGTGPFMLKKVVQDETVVMIKNPNYWGKDADGNSLPYLEGIKMSFIKEDKVELLEFKSGNLDLKYRIPLETFDQVIDAQGNLTPDYSKFQKQEIVEMTTQYYGYLLQDPNGIFSNKKLRQAFNYSVDRNKLVEYTMKGQGVPAFAGMVPPCFKDFDNAQVKGYDYNPEKARQLLSEAGYPNGQGLPTITLQINSGGGRNVSVAEAVKKMIEETLNVKIEITQLVWPQHTENIETGKVGFWRLGWVADYPDPENFLNLFYSVHVPDKLSEKAYINSFRYKSPTYDAVFEKALQTLDDKERNKLYEQADQIAMDDAVMLPLFYTKSYRLLQPYVKNYPQNPMEYRLYREVYFDKSE